MGPRLKRIDFRVPKPHIRVGKSYLAKIDGEWFAGQFTCEWYGLNFEGWHYGLELNAVGWQELYEIVTTTPRRKGVRHGA